MTEIRSGIINAICLFSEYGSSEDLRRLEKMLARVKRKDGGHGRTVVVDWLNLRGVNDEDMKMDR